jgi:hypothetical protein
MAEAAAHALEPHLQSAELSNLLAARHGPDKVRLRAALHQACRCTAVSCCCKCLAPLSLQAPTMLRRNLSYAASGRRGLRHGSVG